MKFFIACALLLCAVASASDESSLTVVSPDALYNMFQNGIRHREALFGIPSYGDHISSPSFLVKNGDGALSTGCDGFPSDPSWTEKPILILERGGCPFTVKVAAAQRAGAAAALIIDNMYSCDIDYGTHCPAAECNQCLPGQAVTNSGNCDCAEPFMGDDGSADVTIPSFLLPKTYGDQVVACIKGDINGCDAGTRVVMRMEWSLPAPDNRVEWSIWSSATDSMASTFRKNFAPLIEPLGSSALFTPYSFVYDGVAWGCTARPDSNGTVYLPCGDQCTNNGKYCFPNDRSVGLMGSEVVQEDLRQLCVFSQANETVATDYGLRYWRYMELFETNCRPSPGSFETCSQRCVEAAGLDWTAVTNCVTASGGAPTGFNGGFNDRLQEQIDARAQLYIVNLPSVTVNGVVERGTISPTTVLRTICNGFQAKTPEVCKCEYIDADWLQVCVNQGPGAVPPQFGGSKGTNLDSNLPGWVVFVIVILVLAFVGVSIAGFAAYRRAHSNMRNMLDDYRRLEGDDDDDRGDMTRL